MLYRADEKTGQELSILGYGCMRFPRKASGGVDMELTEQLIARAVELGVNYFDTAYIYPGSEEALGSILEKRGLRDRVLVTSKLPHARVKKPEDATKLFETSLARLRTDHIDYYLIHNLVSFKQWQRLLDMGITEWISAQKAAGRIRRRGFSFHGTLQEFEKIIDSYDWDFCQIQYNYMNEHYQAGVEGLHMAAERGMPVIIMEPLLGGRLANALPRSAVELLKEADATASPASWGLRWLWNQPEVTVVLSGMNSMEQLQDNCAVASEACVGCLDEAGQELIERVRGEVSRSYKVPCTGCAYCMPCPKGINIPATFAAYNESYGFSWFTGAYHYYVSAGLSSGAELHLPSECVGCGHCVKCCPQGIDVPARLVEVRRRLQPPGFKPAARAVNAIMRRL